MTFTFPYDGVQVEVRATTRQLMTVSIHDDSVQTGAHVEAHIEASKTTFGVTTYDLTFDGLDAACRRAVNGVRRAERELKNGNAAIGSFMHHLQEHASGVCAVCKGSAYRHA